MRILILLSLSAFIFPLTGQTIAPFDTIPVKKNSRFTTDEFGNIFVISPTNDIEKYDRDGHKVTTVNYKVLGRITSIDASNPFEIYVFYRDQNKVVYLDDLLNQRGVTDLEAMDVSQCSAAARSFDNNLWLVDMGELKIKKYSKQNDFMGASAILNTIITDDPIQPDYLLDLNSTLYVLNNGAIHTFDLFINYSKTVISDSITSFQIINKRIVYLKDNIIHIYDPMTFKFDKLNFTFNEKIKFVRIEKDRLYILTDESLILHSYSEK